MRTHLRQFIVASSACILMIAALAAPAAAKSYSADRFDVVVRVLPDGTLDVTETVVFRFTDGTFKEVFRELPVRRTDGVDVVRAEMAGQLMPFGTELGTVEVGQRNGRVRVLWRFRPVEQTSREFVLNYRVRGVVRQEDGADVLVWRATPGEHRYEIASSTLRFELPVAPVDPVGVTTRKTRSHQVSSRGTTVEIAAQQIAANGWVDAGFRFPARTVAAAAPQWQQRAAAIDDGAPRWIVAGAVVFVAGLILLIAWRQSYDAPPTHARVSAGGVHQPPDDLGPAISGVLTANGRPALEHAMATVFSLADRGAIEIEEEPRGMFGSRTFEVTRRPGAMPRLADHEQRVLEVMFKASPGPGEKVTLSKARSRLVRRWRSVSDALESELRTAGFLDVDRRRLRKRYNAAGGALLLIALLAALGAVPFLSGTGPWPLVIALAVALLAFVSFIMAATITPLSNEGVRRSHRWRDYRDYLKLVSSGKQPMSVAPGRVLPWAIGLGLAASWAKFVKTQPHVAPAWFRAVAGGSGDSAAFVAFIAHGGAGASSSSSGGGAGGGAAGGGGSGAG